MLLLGVIVALVFSLQMEVVTEHRADVVAGLLWLAILFAGLVAIERSCVAEHQDGCWDGLLLYPLSPSTIYLAKLCVNVSALIVLECVLIPFFAGLSGVPLLRHPWALVVVVLLGSLGIAAVGTLVSVLANDARQRGSAAAAHLTYDVPEGWSAGKTDGLRQAAFEVEDGQHKAEITVISLAESAGDRLANINRWRQQIQLEEIRAEQLDSAIQSLPLGNLRGDYVELFGPERAQPREAILGVIVNAQGKTWFFKLKGDAQLAEGQREQFQAFVKSVMFTPDEGAMDVQ